MLHDKTGLLHLAAILKSRGIRYLVVSPGSRNAPIISVFCGSGDFECLSIVDERSAAYFALGLAQQQQQAVAIACTSGTAALNYAPAIAEAYYMQIPLLVLTADRPPEWVDQGDGQTIRQLGIFDNHLRKSVQLPHQIRNETDIWYNDRLISEALNAIFYPVPGPVHINIPFAEPLYGFDNQLHTKPKDVVLQQPEKQFDESQIVTLADKINDSKRLMLLVGQMKPNNKLNSLLNAFSAFPNVVVLTETTSNMYGERFHSCIDRSLSCMENLNTYRPDFLITMGNAVVSKRIKSYLRTSPIQYHWHIAEHAELVDSYMQLTDLIMLNETKFLEQLLPFVRKIDSNFADSWKQLKDVGRNRHTNILKEAPYSDMKIMEFIFGKIDKEMIIHLANSTPVRYAQLFEQNEGIQFFSNRGTSGIDGSISTAAGFAFASENLNLVITGDLSFFYDSNALWNQHLPQNLKIVLVNNGGGGIFRFIEGPSTTGLLEKYFEAAHQTTAEGIAQSFGLNYFAASDLESLHKQWDKFINENSSAAVLEIQSPAHLSGEVLHAYFEKLKSD